MRILHIGEGLPDHRIEKYNIIGKRNGDEILYIGGESSFNEPGYEQTNYDQIELLPIKNYDYFMPNRASYKNQLKDIVKDMEPDIIHVHNLYNMNLVHNLLPKHRKKMVYDSHEYWAAQIKLRHSLLSKNLPKAAIYRTLIPKWERKYAKHYPLIVCSPQIAQAFYFKYGVNPIIVPNYDLKGAYVKSDSEDGMAYLGSDMFHGKFPIKYRNPTNLIKLLESNQISHPVNVYGKIPPDHLKVKGVTYHGYKRHQSLPKEISNNLYGLYGFENHWLHYYTSPTRISTFLNAGLILIIPQHMARGMFSMIANLSVVYNNINQIPELIRKFETNNIPEIKKQLQYITQNHLIFENFTDKYYNLYRNVIQK